MRKPKKRRRRSKPKGLLRRIEANLWSGIIVLIPLAFTVFVVRLVLNVMSGVFLPVLRLAFDEVPQYVLVPISILGFVVVVFVAGLTAKLVIGRRLIRLGERFIDRLPVVKVIYSATKQVIHSLLMRDMDTFRSVALVEFPGPGLKAIGFVTGYVTSVDGQEHASVFVPTTPNPTTGFLQLIPLDKVQILDMAVEDAVKFIMSGGIVGERQLAPAVENNDNSS